MFAKAIRETRASVQKGSTLAEAMKDHPKIYPALLVNMVEAGEISGSLEVALERMSIQFEKTAKNRGMMKKAMIYPMVVGIVAIGVIAVMLLFVIPSYSEMFETLDAELPWITKIVLIASAFLQSKWFIIVALLVIAILVIKAYMTTDSGKHVWSEIQFHIPIVKNLVVKTAAANMARTLSTLVSAGIPLVEAVDIVAHTMENV